MQFTYEREGNLCWLIDKLIFEKNTVIHYQLATGSWEVEDASCIKIDKLLNYLKCSNLELCNFPGLKDYLKKNYPNILLSEVLPKEEQPTERELIEGLVKLIENCYLDSSYLLGYKYYGKYLNKAKDYLNNPTV